MDKAENLISPFLFAGKKTSEAGGGVLDLPEAGAVIGGRRLGGHFADSSLAGRSNLIKQRGLAMKYPGHTSKKVRTWFDLQH
mgnify:CR=1 FL=1